MITHPVVAFLVRIPMAENKILPDGTEKMNYPSLLSVALFAILSQGALKTPGIKVSLQR